MVTTSKTMIFGYLEDAVGGKRACFGTKWSQQHQHPYQPGLNKARRECQIQQAKTTCFTEKCNKPGFQTKGAALGEVELHPAVFS